MNAKKVSFDERVKAKNILALNEKVAAIRRFETDPVYKSVGRYFNCSPDQIKRIIKQKDEILEEWNNRTKKCIIPTTHEVKSVKMSFLGRAVFEWIRRMMYYTDFNLTNGLLQTMALEFKKALGLQNFFPTRSWIANFRSSYNLKEVSTRSLDIGYKESHSVQIRDILKYLQIVCGPSSKKDEDEDCQMASDATQSTDSGKKTTNGQCRDSGGSGTISQTEILIKEEPYYTLDIEEEKLLEPSCSNSVVPVDIKSEPQDSIPCIVLDEDDTPKEPETSLRVLKTKEEAIKHVKLLEEFALLKADFRLIGLIDRLEEALKKQ